MDSTSSPSSVLLDDLHAEAFGGLIQNPLGGLGLLENVRNPFARGNGDIERPGKGEFEFVEADNIRWVGHHDLEDLAVAGHGKELVADHGLDGNGAEKINIDMELVEGIERKTDPRGQSLGLAMIPSLVGVDRLIEHHEGLVEVAVCHRPGHPIFDTVVSSG